MNKKIFWLFSALLTACGSPAPQAGTSGAPPAPAAPPLAIIAFGDSLTAGKDLPDPDTQAYPAVLEKLLNERGVKARVVNAGHSGDTTYDALNRLDYSIPEGAALVLVAFGNNDTFQGKPLPEVEKNLAQIVQRVKKKGAGVLLLSMKTFPNLGPEYAGGFEKVYARVAKKEDVTLVPFFLNGVASVPSMNLSDGVHPNIEGQKRMAQNILPFVEQALRGMSARGRP